MRLGLSLKLPGLTAWGGYPVPYLFQNGEQGFWYDPSDFSTLFQDAAGTTPVTAVEQPCSLMLDKRLGLTLGSELVTNGTFDANLNDWSINNPLNGTATWDNGTARVERTGSSFGIFQEFSVSANKTYLFTGAAASVVGTVALSAWAPGGFVTQLALQSLTASGMFSMVVQSGANTSIRIYANPSAASSGNFDNISVRELPGNHAYTPAAASTARPTVSARVNQLVATEDFTNVAWSKGSGVSATATTLTFTTGGSTQFVRQSVGFTSGITYKILVRARSISGNTSLSLDLENAQTTGFTLTSALQNFEWVVLASGNRAWLDIQLGGAGSIEITAIDVRVANDGVGIPNYQRVNTASDYDTVGFPVYLRFDQSNDYMLTNSIDFSGTDKVTVAAGVRKLSDAAFAAITELSVASGANNGTFAVFSSNLSGNNYQVRSLGTVDSNFVVSGYAAPITNVLTMVGDIASPLLELLINGTSVNTQTTNQGTGNYGNYPLYIGARAGTSLFFGGRLYGSVGRGALNNDQQNAALTAYLNSKTRAF